VAHFPALRVGLLIRLISLAAATALFALPASAQAAFPGANGKIVFATARDGDSDLYTMNPDGTNLFPLTHTDGFNMGEFEPAWSSDGTKIAFRWCRGEPGYCDIYRMNADGSNVTDLSNDPAADITPAWSPDGSKIAFESHRRFVYPGVRADVFTMSALDGSGQTNLTDPTEGGDPAWSPDGSKIAFGAQNGPCGAALCVMNPDGSAQTAVTSFPGVAPSWSPDGSKIAFRADPPSNGGDGEIFTVNADGTGVTQLTDNSAQDLAPAWSPDGTQIAFASNRDGNFEIYTMNPDGTNTTRLTNDPGTDTEPDWQPINPSYSHPIGASPLRVPLVPAFEPCDSGNADSQHGVPFDFPSCANPDQMSSTVTVGPNSLGFARMVVCPDATFSSFCTPPGSAMPLPDIRLTASIRDVRCAGTSPPGCSTGADYNPDSSSGPYTAAGGGTTGATPACFPTATSDSDCLAGADVTETAKLPGATAGGVGTEFEGSGVRITDAANGPGQNFSATVTDIGFPIPLDCLPTTDPSQGSTCGVNTTANALYPGVVANGKAAVWQLGQIELKDSGPDGVRGNSDDEVFAVQGVFLP
jgi:Tol biopolymer transport system component